MSVLVVGGAGYIGAHVVAELQKRGQQVIVVDDLSTGNASRVGGAALLELDVANPAAVDLMAEAMGHEGVSAVIHFAARKQVGESVSRPLWYYQQNIGGLVNLLSAMERAGVKDLIFSSSAAVYGMPPVEIVTEDTPCQPINPYGETKLIGEQLLADCARAWGLNWTALRYFNVAGAGAPELGDPAVLNLIPMVFDKLAQGQPPRIFGTDYPTPDGTCIRDYIHVQDLTEAHLVALEYLAETRPDSPRIFNIGTGQGASVREVIDLIGQVSGLSFVPTVEANRAGDPPQLIASAQRVSEILGWRARYDLPEIVRSAWEAWQAGPRRIG